MNHLARECRRIGILKKAPLRFANAMLFTNRDSEDDFVACVSPLKGNGLFREISERARFVCSAL
jgi:hypothetical protein